MDCRSFGLSTFWFVDVLVCRRFGLSTCWFVDVLVCRCLGLSTFRSVDVLVCRRFGLSTFWFVDVSECRRFGCRRFGLSTFWPVTSCVITGSTHSIKKCTKPTHVIMVIFSKMCCRILLVSYSLRGNVLIRDGQYNSRVSHVACTPVPTLQTSRSRKSQLNITYRWLSARKTWHQCDSNWITSFLHSPIDMCYIFFLWNIDKYLHFRFPHWNGTGFWHPCSRRSTLLLFYIDNNMMAADGLTSRVLVFDTKSQIPVLDIIRIKLPIKEGQMKIQCFQCNATRAYQTL